MSQTAKKWTIVLSAVLLAAGLTACGKKTAVNPAPESTPVTSSQPADLPATKEFTLKLEGNEEKKTGKLAQGQGFALYVFDGFAFDPVLSLLTLKADPRYYAHIEKLPSGYKPDEIKKSAEKDLAKVGEVRDVSSKEMEALLGGAAIVLAAGNDKLTQEAVIKEVSGTGYRMDVNMPQGEASEGFEPHVLASFGSIVNL